MVKINNNIKKWFIYIIGIIFFIIALYVMLIPYNCKLKNKGFYESFTDEIPNNTDSITAYMSIIGKNKKPIVDFDNFLSTNKNLIQDGQTNGKLLILSRCYQSSTKIELNNEKNNNLYGSYTETIFIKKVNNFDDDVLNKIRESITDFHGAINGTCNTSKPKKTEQIEGTVYVLLTQFPLYKDNSNSPSTDIKISSSLLSQPKDNNNQRYTYQPSYIAPISNYILDTDTNKKLEVNTSTEISYMVYIIYNSYSTGPQSGSNNGTSGCILPQEKSLRFSNSQTGKNSANKTVSSAEQCFISAMGSSGFSYIGGCASHQGTSPETSYNPNNTSFCSSPIRGDSLPWTYTILYTVNDPRIKFSVAQDND